MNKPREVVLSEDSDLIFFLKDRGLGLTLETHFLYKITRLLCPICWTRRRTNEMHEERNGDKKIYSNILGCEFLITDYNIIDNIEEFYNHMYNEHHFYIHHKGYDKQRDILVKLLQQLKIFAHYYHKKKQLQGHLKLERKIKLGQCIRFLNKECGIPMQVIEFCLRIKLSRLGELAYLYMEHKEGLPKWTENL